MSKQNHKNKHQSNASNNSTISLGLQSPHAIQEQSTPSYQEIEVLAYRIHEKKGGTDLENWLEAERMLKDKYS